MISDKNQRKLLRALGKNIKKIREAKGLNQIDFARACYKDRQAIQRFESGMINPTFLSLYELSKGLGVELSEFFEGL